MADRQVPLLTAAPASAVDGQERPVPLSSFAPPESCCAAGSALHEAQTVNAPHSSH